ncbi:MAG: aminotransferase class I/II-fold pyridoxal phosphate-dependent enzyme [Pseudobdellovibrio sp.]
MYYIGDEELEAIKRVFNKKSLFRYNAQNKTECELFESEFSSWMGASHALLLSSGTNALLASLMAAGIQPGDEVLVPTYTFVATAAAVVQAGAIPVLVNINENLSLDFEEAEGKVSGKTRALILVHMDGLVADVAEAVKFCNKENIILIEDVAQSAGASFQNKKLGTFGDFGCFSFNDNKNITCGEGGALITSNSLFYERAFCYHDTPVQFSPSKKDFFKEITPFIGSSMRVSEIQGAIMRVQLSRLNLILQKLRERKKILRDTISQNSQFKIISGYSADGECASSLHLLLNDPLEALEVGKKLRGAGLAFYPVTLRPAHASWKWSHLFGKQAHLQDGQNPFLKSDVTVKYDTALFVRSVDILNRTLRMEINIEAGLEETKELALKISKI